MEKEKKKNKKNDCIGITYGDPASIGPEILYKTLKNYKFKLKPLIIDLDIDIDIDKYTFCSNFKDHKKTCFKPGKVSKASGIHSYLCLKKAVLLAKNKKISALVTGPVSKYAINISKKNFKGQTDEIAEICDLNPQNVIMLFVSKDFRIALFTRHIPLKLVSKKLKRQNLQNFIKILNTELKKWFKLKNPKIGILGLNPHAGENGLFGSEENKIINPVIKSLKLKGYKIFGPLSPDATLASAGQDYLQNKKQKYDAYVSFYHDQALPLFKALAGKKGVNVTLGLPFLRASVDHGTAFDIAGKNKASNEGLVSAIKLVEELVN